jgi:putative transcription factor
MDCQDWNSITFSNKAQIKKNEETGKKMHSKKLNDDPEKVRLEAPKQLGQLISQARTTKSKNQKQLASDLGISQQILARWESNKEVPTNAQIAKIEKTMNIKLPRCKKVAAKDIG